MIIKKIAIIELGRHKLVRLVYLQGRCKKWYEERMWTSIFCVLVEKLMSLEPFCTWWFMDFYGRPHYQVFMKSCGMIIFIVDNWVVFIAVTLSHKIRCLEPSRWWPVVRAWDQEVCSLCGLRFEPCGCSYDGHWRLTWSLTSGPVGLVEVHASWPEHPVAEGGGLARAGAPARKCPSLVNIYNFNKNNWIFFFALSNL